MPEMGELIGELLLVGFDQIFTISNVLKPQSSFFFVCNVPRPHLIGAICVRFLIEYMSPAFFIWKRYSLNLWVILYFIKFYCVSNP